MRRLTKKDIPNCITCVRIAGSIAVLFLKPLTTAFLVVYTICGITDAIDGAVARKLDAVSDFGSKLDSISDLIFYAVMIIKMIPVMWVQFSRAIWFVLAAVLFLRLVMYIVSYVRKGAFDSPHTYPNKATGLFVFLIPYAGLTMYFEPFCWFCLGLSFVAAIHQIYKYGLG